MSGVLQLTVSNGDFRGAFEQPPLLLTVFFLSLTASSFETASVTTRNFLISKISQEGGCMDDQLFMVFILCNTIAG